TVVATGLGEPLRSPITRDVPMHVVANGTTGGPDMMGTEDSSNVEPTPSTDNRSMESGSKDLFGGRQKDIDYLDIPSFLRTQAD
ncbi:MAG: hypothetical protein HKP19_01880, partial [Xanthomonadales bacterium]|nr:hypothetical protein [Xanthomonadales bacterium]